MKQQAIINALKDRLSDIEVIAGYNTDLGANATIKDWSALNIGTEDMPFVNIRDVKDEQSIEVIGRNKHNLTIDIDVLVYGDNSNVYIREAYNDIMRAIGKDASLGGLVERIYPVSCSIMAHQSIEKVMIIQVEISVIYSTDYWDT